MKKTFIFFILGLLLCIGIVSQYDSSSSLNTSDDTKTTPFITTAPETKDSNSKSSSTTTSSKEKITCSFCNGTGSVKYYYGGSALEAALNGQNDYEYGKCTSCDGEGYKYVTTKSSSESSKPSGVICPSCEKRVSSLVTKKDAAGVNRSWCSSCWSDYNSIMG